MVNVGVVRKTVVELTFTEHGIRCPWSLQLEPATEPLTSPLRAEAIVGYKDTQLVERMQPRFA